MMVAVDEERPKPLVRGARWVSFSSEFSRQPYQNPSKWEWKEVIIRSNNLLLVSFHDIAPSCVVFGVNSGSQETDCWRKNC